MWALRFHRFLPAPVLGLRERCMGRKEPGGRRLSLSLPTWQLYLLLSCSPFCLSIHYLWFAMKANPNGVGHHLPLDPSFSSGILAAKHGAEVMTLVIALFCTLHLH